MTGNYQLPITNYNTFMSYVSHAIEAAEAAGRVLLERLPHERTVNYKGKRDIVTDADLAAQQTVAALLAARYPDHALLGEEGVQAADLSGPTPVWIVDPLDGTSNYSRRVPGFSVVVALAEAGQITVGVTHDPLRQETFYAERGQGAWLKQGEGVPERLQVSATDKMIEALAGLDWPRDVERRARALEALGRVAAACRTVRALGSTALGLAYVAAGRLDAYFHLSANAWDFAAGTLLVAEAGGAVTTPTGGAWGLDERSVAASNGRLHAHFIEALAQTTA